MLTQANVRTNTPLPSFDSVGVVTYERIMKLTLPVIRLYPRAGAGELSPPYAPPQRPRRSICRQIPGTIVLPVVARTYHGPFQAEHRLSWQQGPSRDEVTNGGRRGGQTDLQARSLRPSLPVGSGRTWPRSNELLPREAKRLNMAVKTEFHQLNV